MRQLPLDPKYLANTESWIKTSETLENAVAVAQPTVIAALNKMALYPSQTATGPVHMEFGLAKIYPVASSGARDAAILDVLGDMKLFVDQCLSLAPGDKTIQWRCRPEFHVRCAQKIIRWDEQGKDYDHWVQRRCVKDYDDWIASGYCRFSIAGVDMAKQVSIFSYPRTLRLAEARGKLRPYDGPVTSGNAVTKAFGY